MPAFASRFSVFPVFRVSPRHGEQSNNSRFQAERRGLLCVSGPCSQASPGAPGLSFELAFDILRHADVRDSARVGQCELNPGLKALGLSGHQRLEAKTC